MMTDPQDPTRLLPPPTAVAVPDRAIEGRLCPVPAWQAEEPQEWPLAVDVRRRR